MSREFLFATALDSLTDHIAIIDSDGCILHVNKAWNDFFVANGGDPQLFTSVGQNYLDASTATHDDTEDRTVQDIRAGLGAVLRGELSFFEADYPCHTPSEERWFRMRATPCAGPVAGAVIVHEDITTLKASTLRAARLARVYGVLTDSNRAIATCESQDELFSHICRGLVDHGGFKMAWIGMADRERQVVTPTVAYGSGIEYVEGIRISTRADDPLGQGPTGLATRGREAIWCQDFVNDPRTAPWHEFAANFGWGASAAVPFFFGGEIGVLTMYSSTKGAFDPDVQALIQTMASDIGHALDRFELARERVSLESQLREAQKMEAIGTLAGGIAHDFNNVLGSILGNVRLAMDDAVDHPSTLESLREIHSAGLRARGFIKQILTFCRREKVGRELVELEPILSETVQFLQSSISTFIDVRLNVVGESHLVSASANQLQQVFLNLGTNAGQAIEGTHGRVDFTLSKVTLGLASKALNAGSPPGTYICVSIQDNGMGISPETLRRIFDPFFTTKPVGVGTGLGLSIVKGIVESYGGWIKVESVLGFGSRFEVYFPLATHAAVDERLAEQMPLVVAKDKVHVLYIDDDEAMLSLVKRFLARQGVEVSTFQCPQDAIRAFEEAPYHYSLVVTDYNMPLISGVDVATKVKKIRPDTPVAITSGYINDELVRLAHAAGIDNLIYKPDTIDEFGRVIQKLLKPETIEP